MFWLNLEHITKEATDACTVNEIKNLEESSTTGKRYCCCTLTRHAVPIKLPFKYWCPYQYLSAYSVYCTGQLSCAVCDHCKAGAGSKNYFRTRHVCLRLSSKALDPGMDWIPSLINKIKENKQSMNKTISSWDEPWDLLFPKEVLIVYLMIQRCLQWERASRNSTISRSSTERRCEQDLQLPQLPSLVLTDMRTWFNEIWGYDHCLSLFILLFGSLN